MPIELVDEAGETVDLDKASGSYLRSKLEEAISENKSLSKQVATSRATTVIGEHGYGLVKPEDLVGVPPNKVEEKAKELQEQALQARSDTVRSILSEQGFEGEELDEAVQGFLGDEVKTSKASSDDDPNFTSLTKIGGTRPATKKDAPPMDDPMGNLTGYFEDSANKKRT